MRRIARAANAYPKFGAHVTVPWYADIHSIQSPGAARKSVGAASTRSKPVNIGVIKSPMSPMS